LSYTRNARLEDRKRSACGIIRDAVGALQAGLAGYFAGGLAGCWALGHIERSAAGLISKSSWVKSYGLLEPKRL
jgi:hypothetical protein